MLKIVDNNPVITQEIVVKRLNVVTKFINSILYLEEEYIKSQSYQKLSLKIILEVYK
jgi:hypothetical protein